MVFPFSSRRSSGRAKIHSVRLGVEALEERCVLSTGVNPATIPTPEASLYGQVRADYLLLPPATNPSVLFLGDSVMDLFASSLGTPVWNAEMAPMGAADYAIAGSTTQNVLWQIQSGELNGLSPNVVVLDVGVNNLRQGETPDQVAGGIAATVTAIKAAQPQAQILLLGILPTGGGSQTSLNVAINQTNSLLANQDFGNNVHYLNAGSAFLQSDGSIAPGLMFDGLHPSTVGYGVLAGVLQPAIQGLLPQQPASTPVVSTPAPSTTPAPAAPTTAPATADQTSQASLTNTQLAIAASQSQLATAVVTSVATNQDTNPTDVLAAALQAEVDALGWWGTFSPSDATSSD